MKQLFYIAGLPRSGSTLLTSILNQNSDIHASNTSGLNGLVLGIRDGWDALPSHLANDDNLQQYTNTINGLLDGYYNHVSESIIFDKSRGWTDLMELLTLVRGEKPKIVACVRDVRDILASFEKLHRKNMSVGGSWLLKKHGDKARTIKGRAEILLNMNEVVGSPYTSLTDALNRGWSDYIYILDYDKLTNNPKKEMNMLYSWLELDSFEHDFDNLELKEKEDDRSHGIRFLHSVNSKVQPQESQWQTTLGEFAEQYGKLNFWKLTNL